MNGNVKRILAFCFAGAAGLALLSCAAGPPPREIAEARLAVQDAKNAGADRRAPRDYDAAVAHLSVAQNAWNEQKDASASIHWARLAEAEARDAQYTAEAIQAEEDLKRETERKARLELSVRDAQISALQIEAKTEAERRAAEAEARLAAERMRAEQDSARQREAERQRMQDELARREAAEREAEARLAAERQRAEQETTRQTQAERDRAAAEMEKMKAELDQARAAAEQARQAAETERLKLEEARQAEEKRTAELSRLSEEQEKTRRELRETLERLGQVREEARGLILTLPGSIYFDVNKADVKPTMRARLTEIAGALAKVPRQRVLIEGHTDSDGSNEYNLELSRLRAQAVRSLLVAGGVAPERIEASGYGETRPVGTNASPAGKAQNRRVELVLEGGAAAQ